MREIEEEDRRRHKEQLLKHNPLRPLPNCLQRRKDSGDSSNSSSGDSGDDGMSYPVSLSHSVIPDSGMGMRDYRVKCLLLSCSALFEF